MKKRIFDAIMVSMLTGLVYAQAGAADAGVKNGVQLVVKAQDEAQEQVNVQASAENTLCEASEQENVQVSAEDTLCEAPEQVNVQASAEDILCGAQEPEEESEYANLAIAQVDHYVNVRSGPDTDSEIIGKIYHGAVAQVLETAGEENDWFHVLSGSMEGYIKAEYFLYGDAAAEVIDEYITRYATVAVSRLNVRREEAVSAKRIGYLDRDEKVKILEDCGEWLKVQYTDTEEGYVAAEYVTVSEEFIYGKSLEEERAETAAKKALEERRKEQEHNTPESIDLTPPSTTYTSNEELRKSIVDYAMQFLGGKYVHGGKSLETGTDCSGFTCLIYADFGYSISRTPKGQYSLDGRGIAYSEIQPGDIICYSSNGKSCTHVGLYIGDGQIIHAANSRKGIITNRADYDTIIGVRNVID